MSVGISCEAKWGFLFQGFSDAHDAHEGLNKILSCFSKLKTTHWLLDIFSWPASAASKTRLYDTGTTTGLGVEHISGACQLHFLHTLSDFGKFLNTFLCLILSSLKEEWQIAQGM